MAPSPASGSTAGGTGPTRLAARHDLRAHPRAATGGADRRQPPPASLPGRGLSRCFEKDLPGGRTRTSTRTPRSASCPSRPARRSTARGGFNLTDRRYKSTRDLVRYLVRAAGMDANFLLNVGHAEREDPAGVRRAPARDRRLAGPLRRVDLRHARRADPAASGARDHAQGRHGVRARLRCLRPGPADSSAATARARGALPQGRPPGEGHGHGTGAAGFDPPDVLDEFDTVLALELQP